MSVGKAVPAPPYCHALARLVFPVLRFVPQASSAASFLLPGAAGFALMPALCKVTRP